MRRRALFVLLWVGATVVATALAAVGVNSIGRRLAPSPAQALRPAVTRDGATATAATAGSDPSAASTVAATTMPPVLADHPPASASPVASTSSTAMVAPLDPPVTTDPPRPTETSPATTAAGCTTEPRSTYGGTVTVRFCPGSATLVGAVPATGWTVGDTSSGTTAGAAFTSSGGRLEVYAAWNDGPRWSVNDGHEGGGGTTPSTVPSAAPSPTGTSGAHHDDGGDDHHDGGGSSSRSGGRG